MKKENMGFIPAKNICLLFLLISAALFSTSSAGRLHKSMVWKDVSTSHEERESWKALGHDEESGVHDRFLKAVKTNDYGRYDPAPALVKPPFKLIPN